MKVSEYIKSMNPDTRINFLIAEPKPEPDTSILQIAYLQTEILPIYKYKYSDIMDYIILNPKQCPIVWLSEVQRNDEFYKGELLSLVVISEKNIKQLYPTSHENIIRYIDSVISSEGSL